MLKEKTCLSFFPGLGVSERWSCTPQGKAKLLISGAHLSCITSNLLLLKRIPFGRKNIRYQEDGDDILQPSSPSRWDACVIMSFGVEHFVYACYLLSLHSRWWLNASQACEESGHLLRRSEGLKLIALCNPVWVDVTHHPKASDLNILQLTTMKFAHWYLLSLPCTTEVDVNGQPRLIDHVAS